MNLFTVIILLAIQVQLISCESFPIINPIQVVKLDENTDFFCWDIPDLNGDTWFEIEVDRIQNKNLTMAVKSISNSLTFEFDIPENIPKFREDGRDIIIQERIFKKDEKQNVRVYGPGKNCVIFKVDPEFIGPFKANVTLFEEIIPIVITNEIKTAAISTAISIALLVGISVKYNSMSLNAWENLTPVCRSLYLVLLVDSAHWCIRLVSYLFCWLAPSRYAYLITLYFLQPGLSTMYMSWREYVIMMIYFGSGYENLGYKRPSDILKTSRISVGVLFTVLYTIIPGQWMRVEKRTVLLMGEVSDKYLVIFNDSPSRHSFVRFLYSTIFFGGILHSLLFYALPPIYGVIIYIRFRKSGEVANAKLMKKTFLYHGIGCNIIMFFVDNTEFNIMLMEFVSFVLLWWIWYSEKPHIALKNTNGDIEKSDQTTVLDLTKANYKE